MARKRTLRLPDGREIVAEETVFRSPLESWSEYLVDDGTVIRLKPVVTEILKLENEFDANGNPAYVVNAQNVLVVSAPEDLRRKEG